MGIEWLKPAVILGSLVYALIGVAVFWFCFFLLIDKLTPYDLWNEIVREEERGIGHGGGGHVPGHLGHRGSSDALSLTTTDDPTCAARRPGAVDVALLASGVCGRVLRAGLRADRGGARQLPAGRLGPAVLDHHRRLPVRHGRGRVAVALRGARRCCALRRHRTGGGPDRRRVGAAAVPDLRVATALVPHAAVRPGAS